MINTAIILCAGYGKRLNPITLKTPKPLIKLKNKPLLSNAIDLVLSLGIKKIKINTFYLSSQIKNFINSSPYKNIVEVINDGERLKLSHITKPVTMFGDHIVKYGENFVWILKLNKYNSSSCNVIFGLIPNQQKLMTILKLQMNY